MEITKAVIAAAGYGTRFLPATKNQAKEMLPIVDKPIIHYLVQEAVDSGIEEIIIVTKSGQTTIEDYFDSNPELEAELKSAQKEKRLKKVKKLPQLANFTFVRQSDQLPYGNATPLLSCSHLIEENEAFVYMFGDDLTISETPVTKQLIQTYKEQDPTAILAVQEVPDSEVERYGTVKYKEDSNYQYEMKEGYEKLPPSDAPSNMAQFGRFVFTPQVIDELNSTAPGKDDELWIMDVLNNLAQKGEKVIAPPIEGKWLTTGDPLRWLKANVEFALKRGDIGPEFKEYLKNLEDLN